MSNVNILVLFELEPRYRAMLEAQERGDCARAAELLLETEMLAARRRVELEEQFRKAS